MKKTILPLAIVVASSFIFSGCTLFSQKSQTEQDVMMEGEEAMIKEDAMMEDNHDQSGSVKAGDLMIGENGEELIDYEFALADFSFAPNLIEAEAGQTLTVKIISNDGFHDFVIDELGVASKRLSTGETQVFSIVIPAEASGQEYAFYCSVGNHRQLGMEGVLRVK